MAKTLVEVSPDLHKMIRHASIDFDMLIREIAEEAMTDWLRKRGLKVPDEVSQPA